MDLRFIFTLIVTVDSLYQKSLGQRCGRVNVRSSGSGSVQYANFYTIDKFVNCTWEFQSAGNEYMLELDVRYYGGIRLTINGIPYSKGDAGGWINGKICAFHKNSFSLCNGVKTEYCDAQSTSLPVTFTYKSEKGFEYPTPEYPNITIEYKSVKCEKKLTNRKINNVEYATTSNTAVIVVNPTTTTETSSMSPNTEDKTESSGSNIITFIVLNVAGLLIIIMIVIIDIRIRTKSKFTTSVTSARIQNLHTPENVHVNEVVTDEAGFVVPAISMQQIQNTRSTSATATYEVIADETDYIVPALSSYDENTRATSAAATASPRATVHRHILTTPTDEEGYVVPMQLSPDKRSTTAAVSASRNVLTTPTDEEGYVVPLQLSPNKRSKTSTTPETDRSSEFVTDEAGYIVRMDQNMNTRSTTTAASISLTKTTLENQEGGSSNKKAVLCSKESHTYEKINSTLVQTEEVQYETPIQRRQFNDASGTGNPVYQEPMP